MSKHRVLIIDDEADIRELVEYNLAREEFQVFCAESAEEGLKIIEAESPALLILDIMLPGINGLEVCKRLKSNERTAQIPIIMLSARGEESDIVAGLELGADDYIPKPFSPRVLLARARAVLRRPRSQQQSSSTNSEDIVEINSLYIDPRRHEVLIEGKKIDLTATEFRLLYLLTRKRGWVFTRNQIILGVHGSDYPVTDRSVDVQITGLRKKLGPIGEQIETVRGVGYRFRE